MRSSHPLSERELDVMYCLCEGMRAKEIGEDLGMASKTVKTHLGRIYLKLGARNRANAVAIFLRQEMAA